MIHTIETRLLWLSCAGLSSLVKGNKIRLSFRVSSTYPWKISQILMLLCDMAKALSHLAVNYLWVSLVINGYIGAGNKIFHGLTYHISYNNRACRRISCIETNLSPRVTRKEMSHRLLHVKIFSKVHLWNASENCVVELGESYNRTLLQLFPFSL